MLNQTKVKAKFDIYEASVAELSSLNPLWSVVKFRAANHS